MQKGDGAKPKPPGKKNPAKAIRQAQSERFIEAARKLGADESGKSFELAFNKIVSPITPKPKPDP